VENLANHRAHLRWHNGCLCPSGRIGELKKVEKYLGPVMVKGGLCPTYRRAKLAYVIGVLVTSAVLRTTPMPALKNMYSIGNWLDQVIRRQNDTITFN